MLALFVLYIVLLFLSSKSQIVVIFELYRRPVNQQILTYNFHESYPLLHIHNQIPNAVFTVGNSTKNM